MTKTSHTLLSKYLHNNSAVFEERQQCANVEITPMCANDCSDKIGSPWWLQCGGSLLLSSPRNF